MKRWVATTAIVMTAIATTVGAWHVHPVGHNDDAVSRILGASLTPGHECPACALAHVPTTAATPTSIALAPDGPEIRIGDHAPRVGDGFRVSGKTSRGPPLPV